MRGNVPFDATLGFARDPYRFVGNILAQTQMHGFRSRLFLHKAVFAGGKDAATVFYSDAIRRRDAAPAFLNMTLFGRGGVQGMDGAQHRHRKALFLSLVGAEKSGGIARLVKDRLDLLTLRSPAEMSLQDEMELLLTDAVCEWAGVPLAADDLPDVSRMLARLFEHAAPTEAGFLAGIQARRRADRWAAALISKIRANRSSAPEERAVAVLAHWKDLSGAQLPVDVAAVELLNILRPVVAISVFITFAAHALITYPASAARLRQDRDFTQPFVQEVRRFYPFFPALAGVASHDIVIGGVKARAGERVILDIRASNRDPEVWNTPDTFNPERFVNREIGRFDMIPQGGGDHATGHRCPGEWFTTAVMEVAVNWLVHQIKFDVPKQKLSLYMKQLPALPKSRLILDHIRPV